MRNKSYKFYTVFNKKVCLSSSDERNVIRAITGYDVVKTIDAVTEDDALQYVFSHIKSNNSTLPAELHVVSDPTTGTAYYVNRYFVAIKSRNSILPNIVAMFNSSQIIVSDWYFFKQMLEYGIRKFTEVKFVERIGYLSTPDCVSVSGAPHFTKMKLPIII